MIKRREQQEKKLKQSILSAKNNKTKNIKLPFKKDSLIKILFDCLKNPAKNKTISTQDTLPFQTMFKDGVCKIDDTKYSKQITYFDINYQLAHDDDKQLIFSDYCSFLNYFDKNIHFQMTYINSLGNLADVKKNIFIKSRNDDFNAIREEYQNMLQNQIEKGNNGLIRNKYITFTIEASTLSEAKIKLNRIEIDLINNLKLMGVSAFALDGIERLKVLYQILNQDKNNLTWEQIEKNKLNVKDTIAPRYFDFRDKNYFKTGTKIGQSQKLLIDANELEDRVLADFLDLEHEMVITFHVKTIDQNRAIKLVKSKISDLEKMKIEENKKALSSGYDMDILPTDLVSYTEESKKILYDLQKRDERWFFTTILVTSFSTSKKTLDSQLEQLRSIAQQKNCVLKPYEYEQEECFKSLLPLGVSNLYTERGLTTRSLAVFVPFTTQEIFQQTPESLYYGLNALSNNMIMANRKTLLNANGLILGVPGSGKSFSSKREMTNVFLVTDDDIIICDPEGEYKPLVEQLGGQEIKISTTSNDHLNPLDINLMYSDEDSPLAVKADFVVSMMELIVGGKSGLSPREKSIIDRCLRLIYHPWLLDPVDENIPILEDLYDSLLEQDSLEAKHLAEALEIYVHGSLKVFNHRTNVDIRNRLVSFNIRDLGKNLKKLGMLIVQDQVWNRVTINRNLKKSTWYYMDEIHLLLKEKETAAYSVEIWKRFRKWGGIPTGITQNVTDFLESDEIEGIFENSSFIYMLSQAPRDKEILAEKLNISAQELSYVTDSPPGEGLLIFGGTIVPFKDQFPKNTKLYSVMTTKPGEV